MTSEERAALDAQARIRTAMGNPEQVGRPVPSSGEATSDVPGHSATAPVPGWTLQMEITGGEPPFFIKVVDVDGRTVGSARVGASGAVSLNMPGHAKQVRASIRDGADPRQEAEASSDAAEVLWDLGR